ncbi:MAG: lipoprotein signal peptidase [Spirosomataceae bacterium]
MFMKSPYKYFLLTILLIAIDQAIKLWVHFNMFLGEELPILGNWFKLHYVTNEGMAFGMTLDFIPEGYRKIVLSVFRMFAMVGIGYYLTRLAQKGANEGLLWCVAAILGGAIGNVVDSTFYGVFLDNAPLGSPTPWFHGQVIDMFFFDIWRGELPTWIPIWGGTYYSNPIFNFADASIFCGVVTILFFQSTFFAHPKKEEVTETVEDEPVSELEDNTTSEYEGVESSESAVVMESSETDAISESAETTVVNTSSSTNDESVV